MAALQEKGFNKKGARKTATATMKRSIEVRQAKTGYLMPWATSLSAEMEKSARVRQSNAHLHSQAAINRPSTMAGKIVVVKPQPIN